MGNYYDILGVPRDATDDEIDRAYRLLAKIWHPDFNPRRPDAAERFAELNEAKDILLNPAARAEYDRLLAAGTADAAGGPGAPPEDDEWAATVITVEPESVDFGTLEADGPAVQAEVVLSWEGAPPGTIRPVSRAGDWWELQGVNRAGDSGVAFMLEAEVPDGMPAGRHRAQFDVMADSDVYSVELIVTVVPSRRAPDPDDEWAPVGGYAGGSHARGSFSPALPFPLRRGLVIGVMAVILVVVIISFIPRGEPSTSAPYVQPQSPSTQYDTPNSGDQGVAASPVVAASAQPSGDADTSGGWATEQLGTTNLAFVSCVSAAFCRAADGGSLYTYSGGRWSGPQTIGNDNGLTAMSCPTSNFCAGITESSDAHVYSGGKWSSATLIGGNGGPANMESLSCPAAGWCMAVSDWYAYTYSGGQWTQGRTVNNKRGDLTAISCASTSFCIAVDDMGTSYTYSGGRWSGPQPVGNGSSLTAMSCPTSSFCSGIDGGGDAYVYSGGTWSSASLTGGNGNPANLNAISCPVAGWCVAVSDWYAYTYSGGRWTQGQAVNNQQGNLTAISCPSTSFCMAVDDSGNVYTSRM